MEQLMSWRWAELTPDKLAALRLSDECRQGSPTLDSKCKRRPKARRISAGGSMSRSTGETRPTGKANPSGSWPGDIATRRPDHEDSPPRIRTDRVLGRHHDGGRRPWVRLARRSMRCTGPTGNCARTWLSVARSIGWPRSSVGMRIRLLPPQFVPATDGKSEAAVLVLDCQTNGPSSSPPLHRASNVWFAGARAVEHREAYRLLQSATARWRIEDGRASPFVSLDLQVRANRRLGDRAFRKTTASARRWVWFRPVCKRLVREAAMTGTRRTYRKARSGVILAAVLASLLVVMLIGAALTEAVLCTTGKVAWPSSGSSRSGWPNRRSSGRSMRWPSRPTTKAKPGRSPRKSSVRDGPALVDDSSRRKPQSPGPDEESVSEAQYPEDTVHRIVFEREDRDRIESVCRFP